MDIASIGRYYKERELGIIGEEDMQKFSVVIPLIIEEDGLKLLFEVRAKTLRNQPGEIAFPGGRIEEDEDSRSAAVRETSEELGIDEADIEIIGQENMLITMHNRIIYPYVALIKKPEKIKPSKDEVDHVFKVPISFLKETNPIIKGVRVKTIPPEDFPYECIPEGKEYKWLEGKNNIYFYRYLNYTIWGLTARILYQFINTISETERK